MAEKKKDDSNYEKLGDVTSKENKKGMGGVVMDVVEQYKKLKGSAMDMMDTCVENVKKLPEIANHFIELATNNQGASTSFNKFSTSMSDMSAPIQSSATLLSGMFALSCLFLIVSSIGSFIGAYIAGYVLNYFLLDMGVILIVIFVTPGVACYYHFYVQSSLMSDHKKRLVSAISIFEQAILIGFFNQTHYMEMPFIVLTPLVASFAYPIALAQSEKRREILMAVGGASMIAHFIQGILFGSMSIQFLIVALLYTILAIGVIQYAIAYRTQSNFDEIFITMHYVFVVAVVKMFSLAVFNEGVKH